MNFKKYILIILTGCLLYSCSSKPTAQKLPGSVRNTLNLLQVDPQFVMYLNFKSMRSTDFWKENVSDSILATEQTFGNLLHTFKQVTGASISENLDELYYSNSWVGENAIVLRGVFDRNKLDEYIKTDSTYSTRTSTDGTKLYLNENNRLYFFFKDAFTICASNYLSKVNEMTTVRDTSKTGLSTNENMMRAIDGIIYKENIWMVSTEPTFIRGIFLNFFGNPPSADSLSAQTDSSALSNIEDIKNMYKKIGSISFSAKMDDNLLFLIQGDCVDARAAASLRNYLAAVLALSKLKSNPASGSGSNENIVDNIKVNVYDKTVLLEMKITSENINLFRRSLRTGQP